MAYSTSQGTAAAELLVGPSGALPRCAVLGTARSAAGFLRHVSMWCSLGRLWPQAASDVPAYRETSRIMVANGAARRWPLLAFSCDAGSIRRSLPRCDEVLPFSFLISQSRWTPATSSLPWRSVLVSDVLLVPAFGDLGLWEGMGGSSIFLFSLPWLYLQLEDNCSSVSLLVVGTFFIVLSVVQPLSTFVTVGGCWNRQEPSWLQLQLRL